MRRDQGASRFPGLHDDVASDAVGSKFASLARVPLDVAVPPAIAVPVAEFRAALSTGTLHRLQSLMGELHATVGAFLIETVAQVEEAVADLRLADQTRRLLDARLTETFGVPEHMRFAVRSSGLSEDGRRASFAGVYRSWLDVRGTEAVFGAVEQCWRSFYAAPAIAARIRVGDFDPTPALSVVIQEFVDPFLAGVAFSNLEGQQDQVVVEYVPGTADGLVAGTQTSYRAHSATLEEVPAAHRAAIAEVVRITRRLRECRGHDVDVEWAADRRGVYVVQVRPVTAAGAPARVGGSSACDDFWIRRLYFEEPPPGRPLGDVARVYTAFVTKRGRANRLAAECGVPVTTGWLVGFTGRALHDPAIDRPLEAALRAGPSAECLLDVGDHLRQLVVPKTDVVGRLRELAGPDRYCGDPQAVVVRDYLHGRLGVVSRRSGEDLIVEYSPEGLLALNRGTAGAEMLVADKAGLVRAAAPGAAPLLAHVPQIAAFTGAMRDRYGDVALEWVLTDDTLVFLDYSVLGVDHAPATYSGDVISAGSATGPVLNLDDDELLRRLSIGPAVSIADVGDVAEHAGFAALLHRVRRCAEPPIVRVSRPYAALSVLLGSVAGFVFDEGSVLSHLAILLREAGVPAVRANGVGTVRDGVHGAITLGTFGVV